MKQFLIMLIMIFSSICHADVFDEKYDLSVRQMQNACEKFKETPDTFHICSQYNTVKRIISNTGKEIELKIIDLIPYPNSLAFTGFMMKALVDKKIEIDPHLNSYGRPKLEIKSNEVMFKQSYDLN